MDSRIPSLVAGLVARGALFVVNHSGGKDSQAQLIEVRRHVPDSQIVIIHADLPEADWEGIDEHIQANSYGLPYTVVRAERTFFEMVAHRGMFPSPKYRFCTSELKREPLNKEILRILRERGLSIVVTCVGLRAEESDQRRKKVAFTDLRTKLNKAGKISHPLAKAGREAYEWLPVFTWTEAQVFQTIKDAGQQPHPAYGWGMSRLSCCFCIMASRQDLVQAALLQPEAYARYVALEQRLDHTMMMPAANGSRRFLPEITGIAA